MPDEQPLWRKVQALYHFTDTRNLGSIRQHRGLYPRAELVEMGAIVYPGGNEWSQDADDRSGMDRYVHLCFIDNHPMEYTATEEGRIIDSIFLEVEPKVLFHKGTRFSPGVSNRSGMQIYKIDEAYCMIDFEVLYTRMDWRIPEIQKRRQAAEKCEILVPRRIPLKYIRNLPNG